MYCKFGCNTLVYREDSLPKEPKLLEYQTGRRHNYQRCGNIMVDEGREPPFEHIYLLELVDYSLEDQEFLRSHYPNPEQSKWFNPDGWYEARQNAGNLYKV